MGALGRDIIAWRVAFYGRPRNWLERLVFKPGFRHCIAHAWIDTDRWLEVHPSFFRQEIKILTGPQYRRRLQALTRVNATLAAAEVRGGGRYIPRVATCAGSLAHIIGVRGALRPEGLYRALCAPRRPARGGNG